MNGVDREAIAKRSFLQGLRHNGRVVLDKDGKPIQNAKRVLISLTSRETVWADHAVGLAAMCAFGGAELAITNQKIEEDSGVPEIGMNNSVEIAKQLGVDYILFIAPDIAPRPHTLKKLLEHDLPIVGALYPRSMTPFNVKGRAKDGGDLHPTERLQEMDAMPMGLVLVRMDVFAQMKRPYFRQGVIEEKPELEQQAGIVPSWVLFCSAARAAGFLVQADLEVSGEVIHSGGNQCMITRAPASANDGATIGEPLHVEPATAAEAPAA